MKRYALLIGILTLAIFLRFYRLGEVPVSPDWDEAALGYNAYSILKTGRDEYGTFLPRTLRSFDDYKPPLYTYLAILPIKFFGLNAWAVRLPSAVMGVLAVGGVYLLVKELFSVKTTMSKSQSPTAQGKKRQAVSEYQADIPPVRGWDLGFGIWDFREAVALLSALLLAISPWHLQFSRIAFEANIGITLNIWGLYALLRGLSSPVWMYASAALFGLSFYAYHSERIFVPLLLIMCFILWKKQLLADTKKLGMALAIGLAVVAPLIPVVLDKTSLTRLKGTSSLADQTGILMRSVGKLEDDRNAGRRAGELFDNRRIVYAQKIFEGYISHFSLRWLFLAGDNDRHHAPDNGLMYLWELPFLLWGMVVVWKRGGKLRTFLFAWLVMAPVAASPTSETPHAIRTLVFLPVIQVFTAAGILSALSEVKRAKFKVKNYFAKFSIVSGSVFYVMFIVFNVLYYFHMYYSHMNYEYSRYWQYGYKQVVEYAQSVRSRYTKIVVSTKLEQPHMFFLFYTGYDPIRYQREGGTASGGFEEMRNRFDIYEFRPIDWAKENHDGTTLYIGTHKEIPTGSQFSITYLNGEEAMRVGE